MESTTAQPSGSVPTWVPVSVVMPVLDEGPHLREAVQRIYDDGYPGELEIVLAVGPSRDDTEAVARALEEENPGLRVVPNPSGRTPQALNAALRATTHPVVVRVDAHGFLPRGYIQQAVTLLETTGAANVGGQMVPEGRTPVEQAVARAMSSVLGIGGAPFHIGGDPGPADSVYLGTFRRDVLERLGGFDETLPRAQDWELNYRIRQAGETVWFHPDLRVRYRPRSSLRALARQFHGSGRWRRAIVQRHPSTASWRYLAAPAAVTAVAAGLVTAAVGAALGSGSAVAVGLGVPATYVGVVVVGSAVVGRDLAPAALLRLPVVVATMHMTWGAGFLRGPVRGSRRTDARLR